MLLEVYGDNLCSFTKAAFPTVQLLAKHYKGSELGIRVHWSVRAPRPRCTGITQTLSRCLSCLNKLLFLFLIM